MSIFTDVNFWMLVLIAGIVLVTGAIGYKALIGARGKTPALDGIIEALNPWVYQAILAGEKLALKALAAADTQLESDDKADIANRLYAILPDNLVVEGIPLPIALVKRFVTRDLFAQMVKDTYDAAHAFILRNEAYLTDQVEKLQPKAG